MTALRRRLADERGAVGGLEVLPFGLLVFVVGALLVANAWGVIDAKVAASASAREAVRTFVESDASSTDAAWRDALAVAHETMVGHGRSVDRMAIEHAGVLQRCAPVSVEVSYRVPAIALPWIGGFGPGVITATGRHAEVVDPYRDGVPVVPGEATCGT